MHLFGSRGLPSSIRRLTGFGVHTFKLIGPDGSFNYCKFHFRPEKGVANFTPKEAQQLTGLNSDFHNADLWHAIQRGDYPTWKLYIQVMTPEQAEQNGLIVFDITKVWPFKDFPLVEVGRMTLNKNVSSHPPKSILEYCKRRRPLTAMQQPENYFAEIEQAAFSPSNMVQGIAATPDPSTFPQPTNQSTHLGAPSPQIQPKPSIPIPLTSFLLPVLQARMFAYPDAQRYRLGANYTQLPPNRARCPIYHPYSRDGAGTITSNYGSDPSYVRSSISPGVRSQSVQEVRHTEWLRSGGVLGLNEVPVTEDDFVQPRELWNRVFNEAERRLFVGNVVESLGGVQEGLCREVVALFGRVDLAIAQGIAKGLAGEAKL
jgi:catalase